MTIPTIYRPFPPGTRVRLTVGMDEDWEAFFTGGFSRLHRMGDLLLQIYWRKKGKGWGEVPMEVVHENPKGQGFLMTVPFGSFGEIDKTTTEPAGNVEPYVPEIVRVHFTLRRTRPLVIKCPECQTTVMELRGQICDGCMRAIFPPKVELPPEFYDAISKEMMTGNTKYPVPPTPKKTKFSFKRIA